MLQVQLLDNFKANKVSAVVNAVQKQGLLSQDVKNMLMASYEKAGSKRVRVVCLAADFYVTLLLKDVLANRAGGEGGYDPTSHESCFIFNDPAFLDWAILYQRAVKETLQYTDQFMFTYLCAAVAGELRHSFGKFSLSDPNKDGLISFGIESGSGLSRSAIQHKFLGKITDTRLEEYLELAVVVFTKYQWGGSYGGPKWGEIAKTGLDRLQNKLDPVSFVDRVYDLKHNGGPIFDKNKAVDNNFVQDLLDAKLSATTDTDWTPWLKFCSLPVRECLTKAKTIGLWSGIDPVEKEVVPILYDENKSFSYNASPDTEYYSKANKKQEQQQKAVPDYPVVQDVTACPIGKHNE